jgi:hypothetical protein
MLYLMILNHEISVAVQKERKYHEVIRSLKMKNFVTGLG